MPARKPSRHHATSDHDFTAEELEFLAAIESFKRSTGKQFPTWSETLSVLLSLGYAKGPQFFDEALVA